MRSCPQCHAVYDSDYIFCLTDGNALVEEGEQETLINQRFVVHTPVDDQWAFCVGCGHANRSQSKFCKKCGAAIGVSAANDSTVQYQGGFAGAAPMHPAPNETVTFQPPAFNTPTAVTATTAGSNRTVFIAAGIGGVLVLVLVVFMTMGDASTSNGAARSENRNAALSNRDSGGTTTAANTASQNLPLSFERSYEGQIGGKFLRLILKRENEKLTGSATTTRNDSLYGDIDDNGAFRLDAYENDQKRTGIFAGTIKLDGTVTGTWTTPEGAKPRSFSLTER